MELHNKSYNVEPLYVLEKYSQVLADFRVFWEFGALVNKKRYNFAYVNGISCIA